MPIRRIPGADATYALIAFDKRGREAADDPGGLKGSMSARLLERIEEQPPTDVFISSHGWKGDVPAAIDQYDRWFKALQDRILDVSFTETMVAPIRPLCIGLHWPSLPWGDDELGPAGSFDASEQAGMQEVKRRYADRLGDSQAIREALDTIFEEARVNAAAMSLPPHVARAYRDLNDALELGADGVGAPPGDDREPFDPEASFQLAQAESVAAGFGGFDWGGILSPLRQLSFWTMKKRARTVGEGGMHRFVGGLQEACPARFHLVGHSFGCIVVSSIVTGSGGRNALPRPVDSLFLIQGALSLWAYCADIPRARGKRGYFHDIVMRGAVRGPVVTTQSRFDGAVGTFYPLAAGVAGQVEFGPEASELPRYGGLGTFGICGLPGVLNRKMRRSSEEYGFEPGSIYNLDGSEFICKGGGASGAHSDIDGPEVAHAICQAKPPKPAAASGAKLVISYSSPTGLLLKRYAKMGAADPVRELERLCLEKYREVSTERHRMVHSGQGDSNIPVEELVVLCRGPAERRTV